jgi:hypothetical protein
MVYYWPEGGYWGLSALRALESKSIIDVELQKIFTLRVNLAVSSVIATVYVDR